MPVAPPVTGRQVSHDSQTPLVHTAGQVSLCPSAGKILHQGEISGQTQQTLRNVQQILAASELDLEDVLYLRICLTNMGRQSAAMAVLTQAWHPQPLPATSWVEVVALPSPDAMIEIEATATKRLRP